MNKKYEKYIDYIVNDIEAPYFINMKDMYGLSEKEYEMVLSKVFNQPITLDNNIVNHRCLNVYNEYGNKIYHENSDGMWRKWEFNLNGKVSYYIDSHGYVTDNR